MYLTETCQRIVRDPHLSPAQKSHAQALVAPRNFDEALDVLRIFYHHVSSVTGMPVWLGRLDQLLLPFVGQLDD